MSNFFSGAGVIFSLEMRQKFRGVALYVLLGIFLLLVLVVTVLLSFATSFVGGDEESGGQIYSTVIYFVLLLGSLVTPALSGNSINGDRDAGTLATTQVTLITTWQLVIGKFLAAWVTALLFLAVAIPILVYCKFVGGLAWSTIVVSIIVLALELGVVAAIGVGLSGILNRSLFSIVTSYLLVVALSVGTLIAFGLGGIAVQTKTTVQSYYANSYTDDGVPQDCQPEEAYVASTPHFEYFWGVLSANPYVVLADAVPTTYSDDYPTDLFGSIKLAVRSAQIPLDPEASSNECEDYVAFNEDGYEGPTARETIDSTTPSWLVGLIVQVLIGAAALVGAWARTRTPAGRLSKGSRIA